jgi:hypothetical protein
MFSLRGSRRFVGGGLALALSAILPVDGHAQEAVDVELVIAVDVSLSMSYEELRIQRDGYVAALLHDDVLRAIAEGAYGRIALTYFEWAGDSSQYMVVPWTVIAGREDAQRVVDMISASPPNSARRTSISGGLRYAADLFAESSFRSPKRVVDISGDGPNNQGEYVDLVRDDLVAAGIVINGLPLMTDGGLISAFDVPDLDRYYADCLVGGPGSFVVPVNDWSQFPEAVRRKLVQEIAAPRAPAWKPGDPLPVMRVAAEAPYDCQAGEKRWRGRGWIWDENRGAVP